MANVNLEHLAGRRVCSESGKSIGYIEEIIAEQDRDDLVVIEFHIGIFAAFERLSASTVGTALLDFFRLRRRSGLYRIPWDKLDITDPAHPRLLCSDDELSGFEDIGNSRTNPAPLHQRDSLRRRSSDVVRDALHRPRARRLSR